MSYYILESQLEIPKLAISWPPINCPLSFLLFDCNNLPIQICWFLQYPQCPTFISSPEPYSHCVSNWEILFLLQSKINTCLQLLQHIVLCSLPSPSQELLLTFIISKSMFGYILCYGLLDLFCLFLVYLPSFLS